MQQFSLVYNNLFVFPEPVDEPRSTYACCQFMQGNSKDTDVKHLGGFHMSIEKESHS